ncbi:MAG TPA: hypothetical protein VMU54_17500, partial [Planctomycetota bacterium]|nr:hypothetical protein [Planctomycetota bacterium]
TNGANTSIRPVNILIEPVPIMFSAFLLSKVGTPIAATLVASGGSGSYSYAFVPGAAVTPGTVLSGGGALSGTPTATTSFRNTLAIITDTNTNRIGYGGMQGIAFPPNLPTLSFQVNINGGGGGNSTQLGSTVSQSFSAQGGTPGYTYSDTPQPPAGVNDQRPPGLLISTSGSGASAQGLLSGAPTECGFFTYQMRVTDQASPTPATADQFLEFTISPYSNGGGSSVFGVQTPRIPNGLHTAPYPLTQLNSSQNGGGPAVTWTPVSGFPAGWSLNSQGQVSGPAVSAGTYFLIVQANNGTTTTQGRVKLVIQ